MRFKRRGEGEKKLKKENRQSFNVVRLPPSGARNNYLGRKEGNQTRRHVLHLEKGQGQTPNVRRERNGGNVRSSASISRLGGGVEETIVKKGATVNISLVKMWLESLQEKKKNGAAHKRKERKGKRWLVREKRGVDKGESGRGYKGSGKYRRPVPSLGVVTDKSLSQSTGPI